ncbi:hypothetical protein K438DRAFT_1778039 [Mycena galopus ATCC 62051]|nr:hypothetical protein K438DRAFT_1778039 [Mycena galopus ATCC 62051]
MKYTGFDGCIVPRELALKSISQHIRRSGECYSTLRPPRHKLLNNPRQPSKSHSNLWMGGPLSSFPDLEGVFLGPLGILGMELHPSTSLRDSTSRTHMIILKHFKRACYGSQLHSLDTSHNWTSLCRSSLWPGVEITNRWFGGDIVATPVPGIPTLDAANIEATIIIDSLTMTLDQYHATYFWTLSKIRDFDISALLC